MAKTEMKIAVNETAMIVRKVSPLMRASGPSGDCLYKIAHSWLDPVVNPVQTALGCPLRTEALAYPINGAER
jgi:hypothetical protein